jgi:hypothetical protein
MAIRSANAVSFNLIITLFSAKIFHIPLKNNKGRQPFSAASLCFKDVMV